MPDFLLEIGCEEIPARMIAAGAKEFAANVTLGVQQVGSYPPIKGDYFWTPRRLAVYLRDLPPKGPDIERDEVGPSWKVAFRDGVPTAAAEAFAKKHDVTVSALQRVTTPKGDYVGTRVVRKGCATTDVIKGVVEVELENIAWPKTMYWRGKAAERFVRPVRWIVALLGKEVVPIEFAGIVATRTSRGHRFIGHSAAQIEQPNTYSETLRSAGVILNPIEREQVIRKALDAATRTIPGARWREDKPLVATVVNLTEFPSVILGSFDPEFLALPEEVLVTVMRDHQKYFAIEDANAKLLPHFLAVLNTAGDSDGLIRHGNERVLRARFNDARFFWQTDQKQTLRQRVDLLRHVTFQKDLGSYYDKTMRVQHMASWLAEIVKQGGMAVRPGIVHKAALLAKTDLTTELVKEFTELQGIVGGLYARVQELDEGMKPDVQLEISRAIYDHYKPESMEDSVPATVEGAVLSIADKADSIAGMFALGLIPSGSKDPFALRRQANGIVKTIAQKQLSLTFSELFSSALLMYRGSQALSKFKLTDLENATRTLDSQLRGVAVYQPGAEPRVIGYEGEDETAIELALFVRERETFYLRDIVGIRYDVVNAVLTADRDSLNNLIARAQAVMHVVDSPDFSAISVSFKRIKNILFKGPAVMWQLNPRNPRGEFDANGSAEPAELELYKRFEGSKSEVLALSKSRGYSEALLKIASLRPAIDRFFNEVMVLCEDPVLRANRLALLSDLYMTFSTIADFSEIVTEGKESTK